MALSLDTKLKETTPSEARLDMPVQDLSVLAGRGQARCQRP
jgi:hypothetical protein